MTPNCLLDVCVNFFTFIKNMSGRVLLLIIVWGVWLSAAANSTGHVMGRVFVQETRLALPFAEIVFENRMDKITVTANEYGYYYAHRLPTGKYQMRVKHNGREFVLNRVPVYDGYTTEINFPVSDDTTLPAIVTVVLDQPRWQHSGETNINLSHSTALQPTRPLGEALSAQPGIDVRNGRLFIKGSDKVKFFIDGTPILGQPVMGTDW
ncbi:MAG: hypothetical protein NZM35_10125 [Chitinophagales bacterium]|nr:hypothetical protein [Chitinophagales bacterium]MDW8419671.1 hypothetical protein [Chitinophagales bacterium]